MYDHLLSIPSVEEGREMLLEVEEKSYCTLREDFFFIKLLLQRSKLNSNSGMWRDVFEIQVISIVFPEMSGCQYTVRCAEGWVSVPIESQYSC